MKKHPTLRFYLSIGILLGCMVTANAQFVGIGTAMPDYKLHVAGNTAAILKLENISTLNTNIPTDLFFKTGTHYTGAIRTIGTGTNSARMGLFTYASASQTQLVERLTILDNGSVGIGTTNPLYMLEVNGRIRVRHVNGATAGIYFMESTNTSNRGFVGMKDDNTIGFWGGNNVGWGMTMSTANGDVDIQGLLSVFDKVYVTTSGNYAGQFINYAANGSPALIAEAEDTDGLGVGVEARGGETGVYAIANNTGGNTNRYGVEGYGQNGSANNYGMWAAGAGGNNAYGIYATAFSGGTNWGGYFSGSVYTTGSYQGSDRKLKNDIRPLDHAIQLIQSLNPSTYTYKTDEYASMHLPPGQQYGLIADEVKQVFPDMVKKAVQPAQYENNDRRSGRVIADEVTFDAVNYTALVPVLIAAMQEQQEMIVALQQEVAALKARSN